MSANKHRVREMTAKQANLVLCDLRKRDPLMEVATIPIKFKESKQKRFIYYRKFLPTFPNEFDLKNITYKALDYVKIEQGKDKSTSHLKIILKTTLNTDRLGETELIDITQFNK
jgi:hypothetical protein